MNCCRPLLRLAALLLVCLLTATGALAASLSEPSATADDVVLPEEVQDPERMPRIRAGLIDLFNAYSGSAADLPDYFAGSYAGPDGLPVLGVAETFVDEPDMFATLPCSAFDTWVDDRSTPPTVPSADTAGKIMALQPGVPLPVAAGDVLALSAGRQCLADAYTGYYGRAANLPTAFAGFFASPEGRLVIALTDTSEQTLASVAAVFQSVQAPSEAAAGELARWAPTLCYQQVTHSYAQLEGLCQALTAALADCDPNACWFTPDYERNQVLLFADDEAIIALAEEAAESTGSASDLLACLPVADYSTWRSDNRSLPVVFLVDGFHPPEGAVDAPKPSTDDSPDCLPAPVPVPALPRHLLAPVWHGVA